MTSPVSGSAGYITLPVTTDAETLAEDAISYLSQQQPGWVAREGHLEVWLIRALARMQAETARTAAQVPLSIFQYFGTQLLGLPPLDGAAATMTSTWVLTDSLGHTIPAGTVVAYRVSPTNIALFATLADVVVPAGSSATSPGAVTLQAVSEGDDYNGFAPAALSLVTNLSWVSSVNSVTTSTGGVDAEDQQTYLARLTGQLQLLAPRPIVAADFAGVARAQQGITRATAIDGYNPSNGSSNNARMVAVCGIDAYGAPLSSAVKAALAATLQAQREANFIVNVIDPTYTSVKVVTTLVAKRGANQDAVNQAATAALTSFLSPAQWGGPSPAWTNTSLVRYLTIGALLGSVPGVAYVSGLQLAAGAGALTSGDVSLAGAVPLPAANPNLSITVQAGT